MDGPDDLIESLREKYEKASTQAQKAQTRLSNARENAAKAEKDMRVWREAYEAACREAGIPKPSLSKESPRPSSSSQTAQPHAANGHTGMRVVKTGTPYLAKKVLEEISGPILQADLQQALKNRGKEVKLESLKSMIRRNPETFDLLPNGCVVLKEKEHNPPGTEAHMT